MDDPRLVQIRQLVEPLFSERQTELVDLSLHAHGEGLMVRILADRPGGVRLADCAALNRAIGARLEEVGFLDAPHTIEVSSPGLDRPLTSRRDFERAVGEDVVVQLNTPDGRYQERRGIVQGVLEEALVLKTAAGALRLPWAEVRVGKKHLRW